MNANSALKLIPVILACCVAGLASAKLPEPPPVDPAKAAEVIKKKAELARKEAAALAKAQDRVVSHYKKQQMPVEQAAVPAKGGAHNSVALLKPQGGQMRGKQEKLSCKLGTDDQHARIAVELVGGRVKSFAYYSKWKPRTCSVHIVRDDSWSRWEDTGSLTKVTLNEEKGTFLIDYPRRSVKFLFRDVDRERFCGMEGKISGSLTVTRGKNQCELEGVMDQGEDIMRQAAAS
jgi:hypothetical protein